MLVGYLLLAGAAAQTQVFPWAGLVAGSAVTTLAVTAGQLVTLRENRALIVSDALTGLPNRSRLDDELERPTPRQRRADRASAVIMIDINGFKRINHAFGHRTGDTVLVTLANEIRRAIRVSDTAYRFGGDEYVVLLRGLDGAVSATAVADRILHLTRQPLVISDQRIRVSASIGIAVDDSPDRRIDVGELIHRADFAMRLAKRTKATGWLLYTDAAMAAEHDAAILREDLSRAIATGQLRVAYQPIVAIETGALVGVEALARWQHPTRGVISPGEFIPLAEQAGIIHEIGMWVLEHACRQVRTWQDRLPPGQTLQLNVNVAAQQLERPTLAEDILAVLAITRLPARQLVVEVTESAIVNEELTVPHLHLLREHQIRIALDDFGTGYSSLRYLRHLPVDILKLDRCFVAELDGSHDAAIVADAVSRLGQALHLDAVAEGIETPAQATELVRLGYRKAQGYHYAKPLPPDSVDELVNANQLTFPTPYPAPTTPHQTPDRNQAEAITFPA